MTAPAFKIPPISIQAVRAVQIALGAFGVHASDAAILSALEAADRCDLAPPSTYEHHSPDFPPQCRRMLQGEQCQRDEGHPGSHRTATHRWDGGSEELAPPRVSTVLSREATDYLVESARWGLGHFGTGRRALDAAARALVESLSPERPNGR